jgi:hypothetical protein
MNDGFVSKKTKIPDRLTRDFSDPLSGLFLIFSYPILGGALI